MLFKDNFLLAFIFKKFSKKNPFSWAEPDWNKIVRNDIEYFFKNDLNFLNNQNYILSFDERKNMVNNVENFLIVNTEAEIVNYYLSSILHLFVRLVVSFWIFSWIFLIFIVFVGVLLDIFINIDPFKEIDLLWIIILFSI